MVVHWSRLLNRVTRVWLVKKLLEAASTKAFTEKVFLNFSSQFWHWSLTAILWLEVCCFNKDIHFNLFSTEDPINGPVDGVTYCHSYAWVSGNREEVGIVPETHDGKTCWLCGAFSYLPRSIYRRGWSWWVKSCLPASVTYLASVQVKLPSWE